MEGAADGVRQDPSHTIATGWFRDKLSGVAKRFLALGGIARGYCGGLYSQPHLQSEETMQSPARVRFVRNSVVVCVFAAGLAVGAMQRPVLAWAQGGSSANRFTVG